MIDAPRFLQMLERRGVGLYAGVPDSALKALGRALAEQIAAPRHIVAANEGSALGLAAGHHLATGGLACVYMQNSGLGHAANPLASLLSADVYGIPVLLIIGWRGEVLDGVQSADEPQHVQQGRITLPMLDCLELPYAVLGPEHGDRQAEDMVGALIDQGLARSRPVALVVRRGVLDAGDDPPPGASPYGLSREQALQAAIALMPPDTVYVATTGKASRELYSHRQASGLPPGRDFLTVGAMGHALQIAVGAALARPERRFVCLDGDGAFIMHMGGLTAAAQCANLLHLVINNGAHESAGGAPTQGFAIDMPAIAGACGYGFVARVDGREDLQAWIGQGLAAGCAAFIEVRVNARSRADLPRPKGGLGAAKAEFMRHLAGADRA
jgi:phosphonopyruvate decarboxylase